MSNVDNIQTDWDSAVKMAKGEHVDVVYVDFERTRGCQGCKGYEQLGLIACEGCVG
jgi:hypothetical protein